MATGVPPRDEPCLSRIDLENIQEAMKQKKFRDMLADYCEEIRDPANQAIYQKEMTQLEKERGYEVTFINPKGGYVIKTSVAGDRKAFINICSNDNIGKPSGTVQFVDGRKGMNWQVPYSLLPPREDHNNRREKCVIYDVVFHPDTLRMAQANKVFRDLVNKTAFEGLAKSYNIHLDNNNCRFPKSQYKGCAMPAVIRTEDPYYKPPTDKEMEELTPEIIEKLYPQRSYANKKEFELTKSDTPTNEETTGPKLEQSKPISNPLLKATRNVRNSKNDFAHSTQNGYTIPKYVVKQQKAVDLQDFTYNKDCKQYSAIPSHLVVEINLPLLSSTKDCTLDVREKSLCILSEKSAKYKLDISLPYSVSEECGTAKFDKRKHMLIVSLPVMRKNTTPVIESSSKIDSGVESEENCSSQSDEEIPRKNLVVELSSTPAESNNKALKPSEPTAEIEIFLDSSLGYLLPYYTHNILDDVIALTFHVKNTEPDSVKVENNGNKILIKFTSIGSGFVPLHYAAIIVFDDCVAFESVIGEAWDNNVILQMELSGEIPQKFQIGIDEDALTTEEFNMSGMKKTPKTNEPSNTKIIQKETLPVVEVTNLGSKTNIVVTSNNCDELDEDDDFDTSEDKFEPVWTDTGYTENRAKSILRKSKTLRSFSESSADIASSMDYISSDCIPEESSLKKTVRFNDVIARQFYRYNSSIEGQKKKNQRKKSKKRTQERRKSESEVEDDVSNLIKTNKTKLKSAMKQRYDSGLADTSDAEADCKSTSDKNKNSDLIKLNSWSSGFEEEAKKSKEHKSILNIVDIMDVDASETGVFDDEKSDNSHIGDNDKLQPGEDSTEKTVEVVKSVLNIIQDSDKNNEKTESAIWKSEDSAPSDPQVKGENNKETAQSFTCNNIKHNTSLYDPDKLNKGNYLEVKFKNDLIFDLDM